MVTLGKHHSEETKEKIRRKLMGHKFSVETRDKLSKIWTEYWKDPENKIKRSNDMIRYLENNPGMRVNQSIARKKYLSNPKNKAKADAINRKRCSTIEHREMVSRTVKERWANPEYKDRVFKKILISLDIKPNKPETMLGNILNDIYPGDYEYTGDGRIVISGLSPDFSNIRGEKEVIELFGMYWHNREGISWHQTELGRIMAYRTSGYRCLVIWENELNDIPLLKTKIENFRKKTN